MTRLPNEDRKSRQIMIEILTQGLMVEDLEPLVSFHNAEWERRRT